MASIQSTTGLVTGLDIGKIVTSLMTVEARPRDTLVTRTTTLQSESTALTSLTALLASLQYMTDNLGKGSVYTKRAATSSDSNSLGVTVTGTPSLGAYSFTPVRTAQSQQMISAGRASLSNPLGAGTLRLRTGDNLQRSTALSALNGGAGMTRGKIRITDRSGAAADIDLSTAQTLDDVLSAISKNTSINVTAVASGDGIQLIDRTGATASNLKVQEVGDGTTAASLGLAGVNVAASTADGASVIALGDDLDLAALNDGLGLRVSDVLADIDYTLHDGTTGSIDLSPIIPGGSTVDRETTLGQVLDRINAAAPGKLLVEVDADGKRLKVTDLTLGGGAFTFTSKVGSHAVEDLGLAGAESGGVITGTRIIAGAKGVLLDRLEGGQGLGDLGLLDLTDRSGASASVNLSSAETLEEALDAINASGLQITAQLNAAKTGIELVDTSGLTASNLVVANGDATNTADKLHIAINAAATSVASGDLHQQIINENTKLAALNGGAGVALGSLIITDSAGVSSTLTLTSSMETLQDVLDAISLLPAQVTASINDTGDGIVIQDTAGGAGALAISEGSSTTAADLHLLGGTVAGAVDGSSTYTIDVTATDSLATLRDKINALGADIQATTLSDGSSNPYRLSITSLRSGQAGAWVVQNDGFDLGLQQTARAQDALLVMGDLAEPATNMLLSSSSNRFTEVLSGATLEVKAPSTQPVTVTIATSNSDLLANVRTFVSNYNAFRDKLDELTAYDSETDAKALLTGDPTALRLESDLARLVSGSFSGNATIRTLSQIGVTVGTDGQLALDETKLTEAYADDPDAVQDFFADETSGVSARFNTMLTQLAGVDNSLLTNRLQALQDKIDWNDAEVERLNAWLEKRETTLYSQYYSLELAIAKIKTMSQYLDSIYVIDTLTSNSDSSNSNSS